MIEQNLKKTSFKNIDELQKTMLDHFYQLGLKECEITEMIDEVIKFLAYGGDFTAEIINKYLKDKNKNYVDLEGYSLELVLTLFSFKTEREVKFVSKEQTMLFD